MARRKPRARKFDQKAMDRITDKVLAFRPKKDKEKDGKANQAPKK